jgi:hypothetical protein
MSDPFQYEDTVVSPASRAVPVTPGASPLATTSRALWVGGAGNLNVTMRDGTTVLFSGVPAGTMMPLRVTHVLSTSTTATNIVSLS